MNCNQCNKPVDLNSKFCPHCGAPVSPVDEKSIKCSKCGHSNPAGAAFCEKCGNSLKTNDADSGKIPESGPKSFVSKGNYSGKMVKGKTTKGWKIFRNIILAVIILGIIAIIVWFQVDPDAGEKLKTVAGGLLVMAIFIFFIFRSAKKGKGRKRSDDDYDWDHNDDNDFDSGDNNDD